MDVFAYPKLSIFAISVGFLISTAIWVATRRRFPQMKYDLLRLGVFAFLCTGVVIDWGRQADIAIAWPWIFSGHGDTAFLAVFLIMAVWAFLIVMYWIAFWILRSVCGEATSKKKES